MMTHGLAYFKSNINNKQNVFKKKDLSIKLGQHFILRPVPLTVRRLMSYIYIYGAPILDVSRSHTTTQHSR